MHLQVAEKQCCLKRPPAYTDPGLSGQMSPDAQAVLGMMVPLCGMRGSLHE